MKFTYDNYKGQPEVMFSNIQLGNESNYELRFDKNLKRFKELLKGKWVFKNWTTEESVEEGLSAFYFIENFKQQSLSTEYARMVQYSDCMVDTTSQIFYESG
ncbi:hypothetical protein HUW51_09550 [Adhaeribacter swui]|uniref:Uncharacterized protein n=1 Tax=Adhaeribacter swui TaxID=2086471 RepID=A0A7G7G731_9BACT|nr:hypothetical protein [Adhaeribacter swui]QNF32965.1 hypothetical protein HUW51_09550 [Adhaeribacter swui]